VPSCFRIALPFLLSLWLSVSALALVEPEVEAWQEYTEQIREAFSFTGGEILTDAADAVGSTASASVAAPLSELMSELELRRDLEFKYFTPWHVKTKTQLRQFIRSQIEKDYPPEKVDADEALLKVLGLVEMDFDILDFTETLLTDSVAGAYDPATDQFFLVDTETGQGIGEKLKVKASRAVLGDMNSVIVVHELDHALGGQHFPLNKIFETLLKDATIDRQMAVMALLEGDATFVMMDHQNKWPAQSAGADTIFVGSDMLTDLLVNFPLPLPGMGEFGKAPLFFQKSLIFPYYGGAEFVSTLRHYDDSWKTVDSAYQFLPRSTEEILHPFRYLYFQEEAAYPDFSSMPDPFGDWKKVKDDTGGEFLVRVVLEQYGVDDYLEAAEGWNGDRLRVFRNQKTGALGFYWVIRWDHPQEAKQFFGVLGSHLPFVVEQEELATTISLAFDEKQLAKLRKSWK
jgi:hypothetical protein